MIKHRHALHMAGKTAASVIGLILWASIALANGSSGDGALCDRAAARAAAETGVPLTLLLAITRVETGRSQNGGVAPWPWALNVGGDGQWLEDAHSARSTLERATRTGPSNVDVGCFQLNHRWHGDSFATLDAMLDPRQNALHAARFLNQLKAEFGSWEAAVGAYHSRTPIHARRYIARFREVHAALGALPDPPADPAPVPARPTPLDAAARPTLSNGPSSRARALSMAPIAPIWGRLP